MPNITFVSPDGQQRIVETQTGKSVMEAAVNAMVPGIDADCGGACACATCHVYIDPNWVGRLDSPAGLEVDMLECAYEPNERSRLSCQIKMRDDLDGLIVHLPDQQA
ncbi:MAG: 2Fe-2S iron-sulfur cluster binding domain-containing protein [Burkholderia sp.]|jgi:2Fe-2S ferredoxin|uniref:2Fe-2S iron-sulfur cluster-binding protein n=1 Tax=Burkholderia sp. TaxID=36773 RepID=UPI00283218F2|nr:2Fe-2S iron-sulfur cluster-binding protein [Burkholderia sp.]MDR0242927.1 2Fe-2S iron-sulfur cluster binding domain-containing protein [Burkholderia sp.]